MSEEKDIFAEAFAAAADGTPPEEAFASSTDGEERVIDGENEVVTSEASGSEAAGKEDEAVTGEVAEDESDAAEGEVAEGESDATKGEAGEEAEEDISAVFARLSGIQQQQQQKTPEVPEEKALDDAPKSEALDEEAAALDAIRKDWPEIDKLLKAEMARMQAEFDRRISEVRSSMQESLAPILSSAQQAAQEALVTAVRSAHPDLDQILHPVIRWVDKQPEYLKQAYVQALHSSNPADAIDLITRFKQETGRLASSESSSSVSQPQKEKLRLLKQPGSRRTGVVDSADPLDYEGAFEEAVKKLAG